jgi:hypothetical protein
MPAAQPHAAGGSIALGPRGIAPGPRGPEVRRNGAPPGRAVDRMVWRWSCNPDVTTASSNGNFWRYTIESAKGCALFWLSYLALGVLGTRVFARDSSSVLVLAVFFAGVLAIGSALWRVGFIRRLTLVFYGLSFPVAAGLFLIPINNNIPADARAFNDRLGAQHEDRLDYARALFDIARRAMVGAAPPVSPGTPQGLPDQGLSLFLVQRGRLRRFERAGPDVSPASDRQRPLPSR